MAIIFGFFNISSAQIQQAWVARYNNGITNGTNQAVKMALDNAGNIYVTGFSQNANSNLGYVTIKYAPNGTQLWAARFDSTNYPAATLSNMAVDVSNNVIVTGSALTVKYDSNGNQLWTAPYAGTSIAADANASIYVTGFGTNFNTAKLNPDGSNVWVVTHADLGPTVGQSVVVDEGGNVYVAGSDVFTYFGVGQYKGFSVQLLAMKYSSDGSQVWLATYQVGGDNSQVQVVAMAVDNANQAYLTCNFSSARSFYTLAYSNEGSLKWAAFPDSGTGPANGLILDSTTNVLLVGQDAYQYNGSFSYYYTAFKLDPTGSTTWTRHYPQPPAGSSAATSIAADPANNSYVTGYSPGTNSGNDIVTIKYDPNGNQVWLQRYNGLGNGNDAGNAIAVDKNGNVYVTGYETLPGGGTGIVTIKYSPVSLQRRTDGTVILQAQGAPGENFDVQASPDLQSWLDLGIFPADTNGLLQYTDTNASNFSSRFYLANPQ